MRGRIVGIAALLVLAASAGGAQNLVADAGFAFAAGGEAPVNGFVIGDGHSLRITFSGGGLIVYGATVDNTTNDPSAQSMPYLFAVA